MTTVQGQVVRVGSRSFLEENNIQFPRTLREDTMVAIPTYVALDHTLLGVIYALDKPRENARRAVNRLRYAGMEDIELLTGDQKEQAETIAQEIGADGYQACLLPEQKADAVLRLQAKGNGVIMVGDGINDAPALAYADVGISLGSKSTDIAMETSDIVISRDNPMCIPAVLELSQRTMHVVKQNFALVVGINTLGLLISAASNISVFISALLHNLSTICVVGNSLRLMFHRFSKEGY